MGNVCKSDESAKVADQQAGDAPEAAPATTAAPETAESKKVEPSAPPAEAAPSKAALHDSIGACVCNARTGETSSLSAAQLESGVPFRDSSQCDLWYRSRNRGWQALRKKGIQLVFKEEVPKAFPTHFSRSPKPKHNSLLYY